MSEIPTLTATEDGSAKLVRGHQPLPGMQNTAERIRELEAEVARLRAAAVGATVRAEDEPLRKAVGALNGSELWLDNNHPWRIMLTRGNWHLAVAEQHSESAPGDGLWPDGAAICDIVNAAIKLCKRAQALADVGAHVGA